MNRQEFVSKVNAALPPDLRPFSEETLKDILGRGVIREPLYQSHISIAIAVHGLLAENETRLRRRLEPLASSQQADQPEILTIHQIFHLLPDEDGPGSSDVYTALEFFRVHAPALPPEGLFIGASWLEPGTLYVNWTESEYEKMLDIYFQGAPNDTDLRARKDYARMFLHRLDVPEIPGSHIVLNHFVYPDGWRVPPPPDSNVRYGLGLGQLFDGSLRENDIIRALLYCDIPLDEDEQRARQRLRWLLAQVDRVRDQTAYHTEAKVMMSYALAKAVSEDLTTPTWARFYRFHGWSPFLQYLALENLSRRLPRSNWRYCKRCGGPLPPGTPRRQLNCKDPQCVKGRNRDKVNRHRKGKSV